MGTEGTEQAAPDPAPPSPSGAHTAVPETEALQPQGNVTKPEELFTPRIISEVGWALQDTILPCGTIGYHLLVRNANAAAATSSEVRAPYRPAEPLLLHKTIQVYDSR